MTGVLVSMHRLADYASGLADLVARAERGETLPSALERAVEEFEAQAIATGAPVEVLDDLALSELAARRRRR